MKYVLSGLWCIAVSVQAVTPVKTNFDGCDERSTMFFAYTKDHKKAVEFCVVTPTSPPGYTFGPINQPVYRYTFGPINNPEISILVDFKEGGKVEFVNQEGVIRTGFAVRTGDYVYWTLRGPKGGDARLMVNQHHYDQTFDLARIPLEDKGWGFIDTSTEPDGWPVFYDPMWDNNDELPD